MSISRSLVVVLFALLVACSGGEETAPTPEASPAATPEATPAPPPLPTLAVKAGGSVSFVATKNGDVEVPGKFGEVTGSVTLDASDLSKTTGELTVQLGTVNTGEDARDLSLREAFFGIVAEAGATADVEIVSVMPEEPTAPDGGSTRASVQLRITIAGNTSDHQAKVAFSRAGDVWTVTTIAPVPLSLAGLGMGAQAAALKERCKHEELGDAVGVSVELILE